MVTISFAQLLANQHIGTEQVAERPVSTLHLGSESLLCSLPVDYVPNSGKIFRLAIFVLEAE
jgi:hypothetical protein